MDGIERARDVAAAAKAAGGRALVVGGWVRDRLRGQPSKDLDVEVFGVPQAHLEALLAALGRVEAVGQSFPVFKLVSRGGGDAIDVSLPRRESKKGVGHKGFEVVGDPSMSFADAARRRDFTVNAIGWDPLTDAYEDPFDGRDDIVRRLLKAVEPRTFGDDSLRVLRAVQFAARFEYAVDDGTAALCRSIPLDDLPAERIWGETEKLLLAARPSLGLALALDLGVVDRVFQELRPLVGCPQEPEWHPEGDVWVHTLLVVDQARALNAELDRPRLLTVMLGALCHDLGKPATTAVIDGRIRSLDHEQAGVEPSTRLLDRLNVHTIDGFDVRAETLGLVAHHLKPGMFHKAAHVGDGAFRRLAQKVNLELLARVARADCLGRTGAFDCSAMDWFLGRARALGVEHQAPRPLLLGRHVLALGVPPGPRVGELLDAAYEKQLDGEVASLEQAIDYVRELIRLPAGKAEPR